MTTWKHLNNGNCRRQDYVFNCLSCGVGNLCDVCHEHDELRGECEQCDTCPACDAEGS